ELQAVSLVGPDDLLDAGALDAVARKVKEIGGVLGGAVHTHARSAEAMLGAVEKAGEYELDLDIHADETGDPSSNVLECLADAVLGEVEQAGDYALALDFDADEPGDPSSAVLECLADAVLQTGFVGTVLAVHCCALSVQDEATRKRTIEKVARAGIAIVSLPM